MTTQLIPVAPIHTKARASLQGYREAERDGCRLGTWVGYCRQFWSLLGYQRILFAIPRLGPQGTAFAFRFGPVLVPNRKSIPSCEIRSTLGMAPARP